MKGRRRRILAGAIVGAAIAVFGVAAAGAQRPHADAPCAIPDVNSPRVPANPLALPAAPTNGSPLQGAHFFVDGPRHGAAAAAVAQTIGVNPTSYPDSFSWEQFKIANAAAINGNRRAKLLSKIADQEEPQNISLYAMGGGPGAIYAQTTKLLCSNMSADPGTGSQPTVPVFSSFFIYPNGQFCPTLSAIQRWQGTFQRDVGEMARAIGNRRAVIFEEIDSIGASACLRGRSLKLWLADLKYESKQLGRLPHAVVYAEAGYSDAQGPGWTASRLWQAGVNQVRGFYTNGTHFAWSIDEIRWAQNVSDYLFGYSHRRYRAHFVVNTAQNGRGPALNPHPVQQGIENLCNPPGRGLGRIPTGTVNPTFDGHRFQYLDGFMWTGVPGRSHNSNCPGGPWQPGGVFDPRFALELAQNANQRLGPGYPSQPY